MQPFVLRCAAMILVNMFLVLVGVLGAGLFSMFQTNTSFPTFPTLPSNSIGSAYSSPTSTYFINGNAIVTVVNPTYQLAQHTITFERYRLRKSIDGVVESSNVGPQISLLYARREDDELEIEYSKRLDTYMLEKARAHLLLNKIMTGAGIV